MKHLGFILIVLLIISCQTSNSSQKTTSTNEEIFSTPTSKAHYTSTSLPVYTSTSTFVPTVQFTTTPDTRLTPRYWREWDSVPELSQTAKNILWLAIENSELDLHAFSKVGDCQMTCDTFLGGYANGKYPVPPKFVDTIAWFSVSMTTNNVTAEKGLGVSSVLNPVFALSAGYKQCLRNETPLDCELRTRHPVIVLIGMGTNWIPNAEDSFEKYLRTIVDTILESGALPILATKADNVEQNWKLNETIAQVAYDYDLPLVNVWRSVQDLPGRGIERKVYLTPNGWLRRNYVWLATLENVRKEIAR